ncbi:MAG: CRISPR-associated protein Cas5 [Campylobacteraceae bacterium]|nr:CRISPR-associated protein Cas5 [Campylobacteraceae bacterium]
MFAFRVWSKFGAFKDPFTISQNITLNFPPKTAISGMMAAILGESDFLEKEEFSSFGYSVVMDGEIIKKSFSQNYINDYTNKTNSHLASLAKLDFEKISGGFRDTKAPQKPTNRELLINPTYTIFIKDFKLENEIIHNLKNRLLRYNIYMGNSEFAANFSYIEVLDSNLKEFDYVELDSFLEQDFVSNLKFKEGIFYKNALIPTRLDKNRSPVSQTNLIYSSSKVAVKSISAYEIKTADRTYLCRFV